MSRIEELSKAELRELRYEARVKIWVSDDVTLRCYYVAEQDTYILFDNHGVPLYLKAVPLTKKLGLETQEEKADFTRFLREADRIKDRAVTTWNGHAPNDLNLMSTADWLVPIDEPHDPVFDVIMDSLANGRKEVKDHIERCIVYKYMHPEEQRIPAIIISGCGGIGKNEFVENVLGTIFSHKQVVTVDGQVVFGQHNGPMLGKTVILIDESIKAKQDAEKLKRICYNRTISINMKYGIQGIFDNTAWFWLGSNDVDGGIMIAGDVTDRRWSVFKADKHIMYWIAEYIEYSGVTGYERSPFGSRHPCVKWWNENRSKLRDKAHVSRWLRHIVEKWIDSPLPSALHNTDYDEIHREQKSLFYDLIEAVFDERFHYIKGYDLHQLWMAKNKDEGRTRYWGKVRLFTEVKAWFVANGKDIEWTPVSVSNLAGKRSSSTAFKKVGVSSLVKPNTDEYYRRNNGKIEIMARFNG